MHRLFTTCVLIALCLVGAVFDLEGTNGAYRIGYGTKSKGMGGVSIAAPQEALVALSNPAGMVWIGNRVDVAVEYVHAKYWEAAAPGNKRLCEMAAR